MARPDLPRQDTPDESPKVKLCPLCETVYPTGHTTCSKEGCGARLVESRLLEPGTIIREKYRILKFIGRGGMGTVYLAEHIHLNERHALKFISGELTHDPKVLKRFRQEAQALRRLIDTNIVTVYDLDQADDGAFYIAMEFVAGLGLREIISAGPLPVQRALAITRGVASGLAAAHAKQIIHRDIKPDNILLDHSAFQSSGIETPKLLDFGIAAVKETSTAMSRTRGFMLTPEYAAPEQWMGLPADQIDGRTDLYALGGVLHEMLTGTTCLHSQTFDGWMYQHLQAERSAPSQKRPELASWPGLDALVLQLLAKDRNKRPANVAEFLERLDAVRGIAIKPPTLPGRDRTLLEDRQTAGAGVPGEETTLPRPTDPKSGQSTAPAPFAQAARAIERIDEIRASREATPRQQQAAAPPRPITPANRPPNTPIPTDTKAKPARLWLIGGLLAVVGVASILFYLNAANDRPSAPVQTSPQTTSVAEPRHPAPSPQPSPQPSPRPSPQPVPANSPSPDALAARGLTLFSSKKYAEALPLVTQACDGGSADGCNTAGYMYQDHLGVETDYSKAVALYTKACDGGSPNGCDNLGYMYEKHLGVTQDYKKAFALYTKACDGGVPQGCELLSEMYYSGNGVERDYGKSFDLASKACEAEVAGGCVTVGALYRDGYGVAQDYGKAFTYYTRACNDGNGLGCTNIGNLYRSGHGVAQNDELGRKYLQKGCTLGNKEGCNDLKEMK